METARISTAIWRLVMDTPPDHIHRHRRFGSPTPPDAPPQAGEGDLPQAFAEVSDRLDEAGLERSSRVPVEELAGAAQIGTALSWIVLGQGLEDNLTRTPTEVPDSGGELDHGDLVVGPEVDGLGVIGSQQANDALDEVVDVAEAAGLRPVPIDRERLVAQRLRQKVWDGPPIIDTHPRAVGVEDADDAGLHAVGPVISHGEGLAGALRLVVDGARSHGVDVAPVSFG